MTGATDLPTKCGSAASLKCRPGTPDNPDLDSGRLCRVPVQPKRGAAVSRTCRSEQRTRESSTALSVAQDPRDERPGGFALVVIFAQQAEPEIGHASLHVPQEPILDLIR